jgi:hypothetical protein
MKPDQTGAFDQEYFSVITNQLNNMTPYRLAAGQRLITDKNLNCHLETARKTSIG